MASGSFSSAKTGHFSVQVDWSSTINVEANISTVTAHVYITYYSINIASRSGATVTINGNTATFNTTAINHNAGGDYRRLIYSFSQNVPHNNDGSKDITISASFPFNLTSSGSGYVGTLTASANVRLDTIARASTVSNFKFTNGYIDQGIDFTINSKSAGYYHDIHLYTPDTSGTGIVLINSTNGRKAGGTHHINLTPAQIQTFYAALSSKPSGTFTIYVRTYIDASSSTAIGDWQTASVTGSIHPNIKPKVSGVTATIYSGGLGGFYVQGKSRATLNAVATPGDGSKIVSYTYSGSGISLNTTAASATTGIIYGSETIRYTVTVQDARGRTNSGYVDIYVYPYAPPSISSVSVQRCNADGSLNSSGTYAKYSISSTYSPVNAKNTRTVTVAYSSNNGTSYSAETTLQAATDTAGSKKDVYGGGVFLTTSSYILRFTIKDSYGAVATEIGQLTTAERIMNIHPSGKGIAFGKISETQNSIETPWDIILQDTNDQMVLFKNGGKANVDVSLYKGSPTDTSTVGMWDRTNNRAIWQYRDDGRFYIKNQIALTEGERSGNAKQFTNVFTKNFNSQVTGYIGIRLGTSDLPLSSMITIKGHITSYNNSTSFEASCYYYNQQGTFHGTVATISNPDMLKEVYFAVGNPSGYVYLLLGSPDSSWNYPTVAIETLSVGWAGMDSTRWDSGWTAEIYPNTTSNFTKATACARGGMKKTLWAGGSAAINTTITLAENIWNFKFVTCVLGDTTSPLGIVLGSFLDEEILELHFGAIYTASSGPAGADLFGCKMQILSQTSMKILGAASETSSALRVRKVVGYR